MNPSVFVHDKKQPHELGSAVESVTRKVIAPVFGLRTDATLKRLLDRLKGFDIQLLCTDDWGSYTRPILKAIHWVGQLFTQQIARHNLHRTLLK